MNDSTYRPQKEKHRDSTALPNNDPRQQHGDNNKKRSCNTCRNRKVSCDAYLQYPCTRCRKTGIECLISESKKSGPPSRIHMSSLERRIEYLESLLSKQNITIDYDDDETLTAMKSDAQSSIKAIGDEPSNESKHVINCSSISNDVQQQQQKPSKFVFSPWMNVRGKSNENEQQQYASINIDNKSLTLSLPQHRKKKIL